MKKALVTLFLFFGFLHICLTHAESSWHSSNDAQSFVSLSLSSDKLTLDESVKITVLAHFPEGYRINTPLLKKRLLQSMNSATVQQFVLLKEKTIPAKEVSKGILQEQISLTFKAKVPGSFFLNLLTIPLKPDDPSKTSQELVGHAFEIVVELPQTKQIDLSKVTAPLLPLKKGPIIAVSYENRERLMEGPLKQAEENARNRKIFENAALPLINLLVLFGLTLLVSAGWLWGNKASLWIKDRLAKKRDPKGELLSAIDRLTSSQDPEEQRLMHLSTLLRKHLKGEEKTTQELLDRLKTDVQFSPESQQLIRHLLQEADMVKFARYDLTQKEWEEALTEIRQLFR